MKLCRLALLTSAALLTLCACSASRWARPVTDTATPIALEDLSVLPPQGANWYLVAEDARSVVFARQHADEAVSTIASASTGASEATFASPSSFLQHVERILTAGRDQDRAIGATCDTRLTRRHGDFCVEYVETFLDRGAPNAEGRTLRVENRGCWFLHPDDASRSVVLLYSVRRPSSEPAGSSAATERFFSGVRLGSPR
ncbi:MAG: hypothetical protein P8M11_16280 [Planctomycetota bacterium]|nr:hypothetical protein [Planctomycetota bacterium]